jgi:exosortase
MTASQIKPPRLERAAALEHVPWRVFALLALVLGAYHYSLSTLARGLALQTPLAYLALVPLLALGLAWVRLGRPLPERPIHDRQIDYIVGLGLVGIAVGLLAFLPGTLAARFWLYRIDLLTLPIFVAGLIAILYGVRRLWSVKVPVAFLILAWPLPYLPLLGEWLVGFTDVTAAAVGLVTLVLPIAQMSPGDATVFYVGTDLDAFAVSIGTACAGVNSLVGFLLIGTALATIVRGSTRRRIAWLVGGLFFIWLLNIVRIEAIFLIGHLFGRQAALDVLHPFAGLLLFNVGLVAMLFAAPRMGLTIGDSPPELGTALRTPTSVRRMWPALVVALALCVPLATVNASFSRYETIATPLGEARRVAPFNVREAQVPGWESSFSASNPAVKQFFGERSRWDRLLYTSTPAASITTNLPVYVDIIDTDNPDSLAVYGLEECYGFHGYRIESIATADLGSGIMGEVIDYHDAKLRADWSVVVWEWPYQEDGKTWFERIAIFVSSGPIGRYVGVDNIEVATQSERFRSTDQFLVALARQIVNGQMPGTGAGDA